MRRLMLLALPFAIAACAPSDRSANETAPTAPVAEVRATGATSAAPAPSPTEPTVAGTRTATLAATQGNTATASLTFTSDAGGVRITGEMSGLAASGEHGFHIHETGDCSAPDASSAGGHFNPSAAPHGRPDSGQHHAGDMYNVVADAQGNARVDSLAAGVTLGGGAATDVVGRAIVVHRKADDYTSQPAGDSGDRIACGVIR